MHICVTRPQWLTTFCRRFNHQRNANRTTVPRGTKGIRSTMWLSHTQNRHIRIPIETILVTAQQQNLVVNSIVMLAQINISSLVNIWSKVSPIVKWQIICTIWNETTLEPWLTNVQSLSFILSRLSIKIQNINVLWVVWRNWSSYDGHAL